MTVINKNHQLDMDCKLLKIKL